TDAVLVEALVVRAHRELVGERAFSPGHQRPSSRAGFQSRTNRTLFAMSRHRSGERFRSSHARDGPDLFKRHGVQLAAVAFLLVVGSCSRFIPSRPRSAQPRDTPSQWRSSDELEVYFRTPRPRPDVRRVTGEEAAVSKSDRDSDGGELLG